MIQIPLDHTKTKQVFLFVKDFKWNSAFDAERFAGLPKINQVYRAFYNEDTKNYKILITEQPEVNALMLDNLISMNPEGDCLCEFIPLNSANLLDHDLSEESLDKLINWMKPNIETGLMKLAKESKEQQMHEQANIMAQAIESMAALLEVDPAKFEILLTLTDILIEESLEEFQDPAIHLVHNPSTSTGINVARVLRNLDRYTSDNVRVSRDPDDILDSVVALVNELEARQNQD